MSHKNIKSEIVFINTVKHAMAEHDTNRILWKWEYFPSCDTVIFGEKSRHEINKGL